MKTNIDINKIDNEILYIKDFGATYNNESCLFKVWSPYSSKVEVIIYETNDGNENNKYAMTEDEFGVWTIRINKDIVNKFYNFILTNNGGECEIVDPYAIASTSNSKRGMIVDLDKTNPIGWHSHHIPKPISRCSSILYEGHVRSLSIDKNSGIKNKGLYLGLSEIGTNYNSVKTGVDHLKELGITHLHLLPVFDFYTVDETLKQEFNWGYDPELFNVLEGSYSSDSSDGNIRIKEFKEMIKVLHENDIRVVMDVVYNHTFKTNDSNFNYLTKNYFYRTNSEGYCTNGSGCGNELATEKPMVRKFIIDSLKYWMTEYKIDGFRFDLMGLYDIKTCDEISKELHLIKPDVLLYGEPWVGFESSLPYEQQMKKGNQKDMGIALFNDNFRNDIKGDNDGYGRGFVMGEDYYDEWIKYGISGGIDFNNDIKGFTSLASETINYVSSHDNLCLYDKFVKTEGCHDKNKLERMNILSLSILLTSFGIPFIQAGAEFLATKHNNHNSYNASDDINKIDWALKEKNFKTFAFVRDMIKFRKSQNILHLEKPSDIRNALQFLESPRHTVMYSISSDIKEDYHKIVVIHNTNNHPVRIQNNEFIGCRCLTNGDSIELDYSKMQKILNSEIEISKLSTTILVIN